MRAMKLGLIGMALQLLSADIWAACNLNSGPCINIAVTSTEFIAADVARLQSEASGAFNVYGHPAVLRRETIHRTINGVSTTIQGPSYGLLNGFENCNSCGNESAGYQLKIYSKDQDPTKGKKFDKPIL